eukprot:CAMPEP_0171066780 /NCGR_PEP_ID=MMETSP0766_2-20121228/7614_1 /TAXON_ID=439317 /ORGANISM="Gambierdiscus australes, Strain CAWD 149" /LENGTH=474 /DNA_ID=CAMNT_0011522971 /DNA_START=101 /DNA_END=1523 /DNA_ORIENTATION=+
MSWRDQSTFKPSSALVDEEKEFLKLAKKLRDVFKLEERQIKGEALEPNQLDKIIGKEKMVKEVVALAAKLPSHTEVFQKNEDIMDLLPSSIRQSISKKRQEDETRRQRKETREVEERKRPEFMCRHEKPIVGVVVSNNSDYLFTCSKDKYVLCWSLRDPLLKCITTFAGHTGAVGALDIAQGFRLVSGGADGLVILWEADPKLTKPCSVVSPSTTLDHGGMVKVLHWCPFDEGGPRRFASASDKLISKPPAIAVWNVSLGGKIEQALLLENLPTKANALQWGGGAKIKLFSAHDNGYVGVWLAEAPGSLLKTIKLHTGPVTSLHITPDGTTLITASHDTTVKVVDITTKETSTLATYRANRPLRAVTASVDFKPGEAGQVVVGGGRAERDITTSKDLVADEFEGTVLSAESGMPVASGKGHIGPVHHVLSLPELGPNGAFATISEEGASGSTTSAMGSSCTVTLQTGFDALTLQ